MKNKKLTYVLVAGVAVVWGLIFYRVFTGVGGADNLPLPAVKKVVQEEEQPDTDTFSLAADYRDPFLGKQYTPAQKQQKKEAAARKELARQQAKAEKEKERVLQQKALDWSYVVYRGVFNNRDKNVKTGLITVRNKDYIVAEGDSVAQLRVVRLYADSIGISCQGNFSYIKKN